MISDRAVITIARFAFGGRDYCGPGDPYIQYLQYWQNRKVSKLIEQFYEQDRFISALICVPKELLGKNHIRVFI